MRLQDEEENQGDCAGCGSTHAERLLSNHSREDAARGLSECPLCFTQKCCMCDMGDVNCVYCHGTYTPPSN